MILMCGAHPGPTACWVKRSRWRRSGADLGHGDAWPTHFQSLGTAVIDQPIPAGGSCGWGRWCGPRRSSTTNAWSPSWTRPRPSPSPPPLTAVPHGHLVRALDNNVVSGTWRRSWQRRGKMHRSPSRCGAAAPGPRFWQRTPPPWTTRGSPTAHEPRHTGRGADGGHCHPEGGRGRAPPLPRPAAACCVDGFAAGNVLPGVAADIDASTAHAQMAYRFVGLIGSAARLRGG